MVELVVAEAMVVDHEGSSCCVVVGGGGWRMRKRFSLAVPMRGWCSRMGLAFKGLNVISQSGKNLRCHCSFC